MLYQLHVVNVIGVEQTKYGVRLITIAKNLNQLNIHFYFSVANEFDVLFQFPYININVDKKLNFERIMLSICFFFFCNRQNDTIFIDF